jgi:hypothetical protein
MYDPALGRFTQIDLMADFMPGINPYSFGYDNPILYGDPDGLGPLLDLWRKVKDGVMATLGYQKHGSYKTDSKSGGKRSNNVSYSRNGNTGKSKSSSADTGSNEDTGPDMLSIILPQSGFTSPEINTRPEINPLPQKSFDNLTPDFTIGRNTITGPAPGRRVSFALPIRFGWRSVSVINADKTHMEKLAQLLINNPNYRLTIMANSGISQQEENFGEYRSGYDSDVRSQTGFFIDDNGNTGTAGQQMLSRGRALRRALISLGVNPSQLSVGFGGVVVESDRTSFNLENTGR